MNLFGLSYEGELPFILKDSPFDQWYVDPFASQLILQGRNIPEPGSIALMALGGLTIVSPWRFWRRLGRAGE